MGGPGVGQRPAPVQQYHASLESDTAPTPARDRAAPPPQLCSELHRNALVGAVEIDAISHLHSWKTGGFQRPEPKGRRSSAGRGWVGWPRGACAAPRGPARVTPLPADIAFRPQRRLDPITVVIPRRGPEPNLPNSGAVMGGRALTSLGSLGKDSWAFATHLRMGTKIIYILKAIACNVGLYECKPQVHISLNIPPFPRKFPLWPVSPRTFRGLAEGFAVSFAPITSSLGSSLPGHVRPRPRLLAHSEGDRPVRTSSLSD